MYTVYTISQPSMLYLVAGAEPHTSGKSDLDTGHKNYSTLGSVLFKKRGKKPDSYFFIAPLPPSSNVWLKIAPSLPHTAMGEGQHYLHHHRCGTCVRRLVKVEFFV